MEEPVKTTPPPEAQPQTGSASLFTPVTPAAAHSIEKDRHRVRAALGAAAIALLAVAFLWSAAHFFPGEPRIAPKPETPSGVVASFGYEIKAESVVEVPFGERVVLDDLTAGSRYDYETSPYLQEEWEGLADEQRARLEESEGWDYEQPAFAARVVRCSMVSEAAFREWYPLYELSSVNDGAFAEEDVRIVVVEMELENLADESQEPLHPLLRCALFSRREDMFAEGMPTASSAMEAMYGIYGLDDHQAAILGGYDQVQPGEKKTVTYAYKIYRNTFSDPSAIDTVSLADMDVAYFDCNPFEIIALQLGEGEARASRWNTVA